MQFHEYSISGIGVDILELQRVVDIHDLQRFAEYFLTESEIDEFDRRADKVSFIASRFAAKEAVIKAFPGRLRPHDFSITKKGVKPVVRFTRPRKGLIAHVSIAHSTEYVAGYAMVVRTA